jgi:hypothetical protein
MSTDTLEAQKEPKYEPLEFADRYYIQTAKNAIESLTHLAEEIVTNEDEAITRRSKRDGGTDEGRIVCGYDPGTMWLEVTGDGDGMTADVMRKRLKRVGENPEDEARRSFFHRGVREVFLAMGGGEMISIGKLPSGEQVLSHVVFDPRRGMAIVEEDRPVTAEDRAQLCLAETGTRVRVPVRRFAAKKTKQFHFGAVEAQIRDCVGLRPVMTDPNREIVLEYGEEPPRRLQFEYPAGEDLVVAKTVEIDGHTATLWAKAANKPVKGGMSRRTRRNGILVRSERAAYEASLGEMVRNHPAMARVFGELRIDDIETMQREADKDAEDESQLIYKPDRSGLNAEHEFVETIHKFIDNTLAPLIADLDAGEKKKPVSADMRRQLQKLAREINRVIEDATVGDFEDQDGKPKPEAEKDDDKDKPEPPDPPDPKPREVEDGIGLAYDRIFLEAGASRTVKVWIDVAKVPVGTEIRVTSGTGDMVTASTLSGDSVPEAGKDGIAELNLTLKAGGVEGRHEVVVEAGGYAATLPVHVRFPRASGFISQIIPEDTDWEAGSALWDPATGVVRVFVGRPEFKDAEARAKRDKQPDAWKHPIYRQLVVESVREAALWPAAARRAEVEWDELPQDERQDTNGFYRLVQTSFQELDYQLRSKLLKVFVEA